jgi:hypothetical protein
MVALLVRINRHYVAVEQRLGTPPVTAGSRRRGLEPVVFVSRLDEGLERAMHYAASLEADGIHAVHIGRPKTSLATAFWARYGVTLAFEPTHRRFTRTARRFVRNLRSQHPDRFVAAVVPELVEETNWLQVLLHSRALRLKAGLLFEPGVAVINVPTLPADSTLLGRPAERHVVLVPVATLHSGTLETLEFARLLRPFEVRAVHFHAVEAETERLLRQWEEAGLDLPLDVIAAPYREIVDPLLATIGDLKTSRGADLVTVVIGEMVFRWWHHPLHNHRALEIKAALLFEPGVAVASVPHHLSAPG